MTDELKSKAQRLEAMLALALGAQTAPGRKPTYEEIAAWHAGNLNEPRASEVKAHVARDPECYRFWYELRLEERASDPSHQPQQIAGTTRKRPDLGIWTRLKALIPVSTIGVSTAGFAGAMAVVFAVMIVLQLVRSPDLYERIELQYAAWEEGPPRLIDWPWRKIGVQKSLGPLEELLAKPDPEKNAFRAGARAALERLAAGDTQWQRTIEGLPDALRTCPDDDLKPRCQEHQRLMHATGQWSVLVYLSCKSISPRSETFWAEQHEVLKGFRSELARINVPGKLARHIRGWKPQAGGGSAGFCEGAETMLTLGLSH